MDNRRLVFPIKLLSFLVIFCFLLPNLKLGGFGFKLDMLLTFPLFICLFLTDIKVKRLNMFALLFTLALLLFVNLILSDSIGLYYFSNITQFYFPTEFIQIITRVCVFYSFFCIVYKKYYTYESLLTLMTIIYLIALLFGVLQSFNISIINNIAKLYALSDVQVNGFESAEQRGFGVSGNIISWGGISGLLFFYFLYLEKRQVVKFIGVFLAISNLMLAMSRSAIISLVVSLIISQIYYNVFLKKSYLNFFKIVIFYSITFFTGFFVLVTFFNDRYELLQKRFMNLDDALNHTGRGSQREFFLNFMNSDYVNYFLGIGKPTLDKLGYLEMEPLFLLVAYGVVGFCLHYLLLFIILKFCFKIKKVNYDMFTYVVVSTIFYCIFSIGFFFFREGYSGLPFWIILGVVCAKLFNDYEAKYL